jgi:hypothetical protein
MLVSEEIKKKRHSYCLKMNNKVYSKSEIDIVKISLHIKIKEMEEYEK